MFLVAAFLMKAQKILAPKENLEDGDIIQQNCDVINNSQEDSELSEDGPSKTSEIEDVLAEIIDFPSDEDCTTANEGSKLISNTIYMSNISENTEVPENSKTSEDDLSNISNSKIIFADAYPSSDSEAESRLNRTVSIGSDMLENDAEISEIWVQVPSKTSESEDVLAEIINSPSDEEYKATNEESKLIGNIIQMSNTSDNTEMPDNSKTSEDGQSNIGNFETKFDAAYSSSHSESTDSDVDSRLNSIVLIGSEKLEAEISEIWKQAPSKSSESEDVLVEINNPPSDEECRAANEPSKLIGNTIQVSNASDNTEVPENSKTSEDGLSNIANSETKFDAANSETYCSSDSESTDSDTDSSSNSSASSDSDRLENYVENSEILEQAPSKSSEIEDVLVKIINSPSDEECKAINEPSKLVSNNLQMSNTSDNTKVPENSKSSKDGQSNIGNSEIKFAETYSSSDSESMDSDVDSRLNNIVTIDSERLEYDAEISEICKQAPSKTSEIEDVSAEIINSPSNEECKATNEPSKLIGNTIQMSNMSDNTEVPENSKTSEDGQSNIGNSETKFAETYSSSDSESTDSDVDSSSNSSASSNSDRLENVAEVSELWQPAPSKSSEIKDVLAELINSPSDEKCKAINEPSKLISNNLQMSNTSDNNEVPENSKTSEDGLSNIGKSEIEFTKAYSSSDSESTDSKDSTDMTDSVDSRLNSIVSIDSERLENDAEISETWKQIPSNTSEIKDVLAELINSPSDEECKAINEPSKLISNTIQMSNTSDNTKVPENSSTSEDGLSNFGKSETEFAEAYSSSNSESTDSDTDSSFNSSASSDFDRLENDAEVSELWKQAPTKIGSMENKLDKANEISLEKEHLTDSQDLTSNYDEELNDTQISDKKRTPLNLVLSENSLTTLANSEAKLHETSISSSDESIYNDQDSKINSISIKHNELTVNLPEFSEIMEVVPIKDDVIENVIAKADKSSSEKQVPTNVKDSSSIDIVSKNVELSKNIEVIEYSQMTENISIITESRSLQMQTNISSLKEDSSSRDIFPNLVANDDMQQNFKSPVKRALFENDLAESANIENKLEEIHFSSSKNRSIDTDTGPDSNSNSTVSNNTEQLEIEDELSEMLRCATTKTTTILAELDMMCDSPLEIELTSADKKFSSLGTVSNNNISYQYSEKSGIVNAINVTPVLAEISNFSSCHKSTNIDHDSNGDRNLSKGIEMLEETLDISEVVLDVPAKSTIHGNMLNCISNYTIDVESSEVKDCNSTNNVTTKFKESKNVIHTCSEVWKNIPTIIDNPLLQKYDSSSQTDLHLNFNNNISEPCEQLENAESPDGSERSRDNETRTDSNESKLADLNSSFSDSQSPDSHMHFNWNTKISENYTKPFEIPEYVLMKTTKILAELGKMCDSTSEELTNVEEELIPITKFSDNFITPQYSKILENGSLKLNNINTKLTKISHSSSDIEFEKVDTSVTKYNEMPENSPEICEVAGFQMEIDNIENEFDKLYDFYSNESIVNSDQYLSSNNGLVKHFETLSNTEGSIKCGQELSQMTQQLSEEVAVKMDNIFIKKPNLASDDDSSNTGPESDSISSTSSNSDTPENTEVSEDVSLGATKVSNGIAVVYSSSSDDEFESIDQCSTSTNECQVPLESDTDSTLSRTEYNNKLESSKNYESDTGSTSTIGSFYSTLGEIAQLELPVRPDQVMGLHNKSPNEKTDLGSECSCHLQKQLTSVSDGCAACHSELEHSALPDVSVSEGILHSFDLDSVRDLPDNLITSDSQAEHQSSDSQSEHQTSDSQSEYQTSDSQSEHQTSDSPSKYQTSDEEAFSTDSEDSEVQEHIDHTLPLQQVFSETLYIDKEIVDTKLNIGLVNTVNNNGIVQNTTDEMCSIEKSSTRSGYNLDALAENGMDYENATSGATLVPNLYKKSTIPLPTQPSYNSDVLTKNRLEYEKAISECSLFSGLNNRTNSYLPHQPVHSLDTLAENRMYYEKAISQSDIFSDLSNSKEPALVSQPGYNLEALAENTLDYEKSISQAMSGSKLTKKKVSFLSPQTSQVVKYYDIILNKNLEIYNDGLKEFLIFEDPTGKGSERNIKCILNDKETSESPDIFLDSDNSKISKNDKMTDNKDSFIAQVDSPVESQSISRTFDNDVLATVADNVCKVSKNQHLEENLIEYHKTLPKHCHHEMPSMMHQNKSVTHNTDADMEDSNIIMLQNNISDYNLALKKYLENSIQKGSCQINNLSPCISDANLEINIADYNAGISKYMHTNFVDPDRCSENIVTDFIAHDIQNDIIRQNLKDYNSQIDLNESVNTTFIDEPYAKERFSESDRREFALKTVDEVVAEAKRICDCILLDRNLDVSDAKRKQIAEKVVHKTSQSTFHINDSRGGISESSKDNMAYMSYTSSENIKGTMPEVYCSSNKTESSDKTNALQILKDKTVNNFCEFSSIANSDIKTHFDIQDKCESKEKEPSTNCKPSHQVHFSNIKYDKSKINVDDTCESKENAEDDIFKVLDMTDEIKYHCRDVCSPKSSPKLMRLMRTLASGGYYDDDSENSEDDEKTIALEIHPVTSPKLPTLDEEHIRSKKIDKSKTTTNLEHILQQNIEDYNNEIDYWLHNYQKTSVNNLSESTSSKEISEADHKNFVKKKADQVVAEAKLICDRILMEHKLGTDKTAEDDETVQKPINIGNDAVELQLNGELLNYETKHEEEDDIFAVLGMTEENDYDEDLCSPKSSPKLMRLIQSLALDSSFENELDDSDNEENELVDKDPTDDATSTPSTELVETDGKTILTSQVDDANHHTKESIDSNNIQGNNNIKFISYPQPPPRKKKSRSVSCLQSAIFNDEYKSFAKYNTNTYNHVFEQNNLIVPPPRKNRKKNSMLPMSYSMSDVSIIDFDVDFLRDLTRTDDQRSVIDNDQTDLHYNTYKKDSRHEIHFAAPEISASRVNYNIYDSREQAQRASIVLIDELDDTPAPSKTFMSKDTPHVRKKSYTFTSSDTYAKEARERVNVKRSKSSVSKMIRKTFSLRKGSKNQEPSCMPNLLKRYIRVRKNKKKRKAKDLEDIPEEYPKLTKTESFASIFMGSSCENLDIENLDTYVSSNFLSFPEDSSPGMQRSFSNLELLSVRNNDSDSIRKKAIKRSSSFIQLTANPKSFVKRLVTEDSTVSLNPDAIKRAHELLNKSLELGSSDSKSKLLTSNDQFKIKADPIGANWIDLKCTDDKSQTNTNNKESINAAQAIMSKKYIQSSLASLSRLTNPMHISNSAHSLSGTATKKSYDEKQFKAPLSLLKLKNENPNISTKSKSTESLETYHECSKSDSIVIHSFKVSSSSLPPPKKIPVDEELVPESRVVYSFPYTPEIDESKTDESAENEREVDSLCKNDMINDVSNDTKDFDGNVDGHNIPNGIADVIDIEFSLPEKEQFDLLDNGDIQFNQIDNERDQGLQNPLQVLKDINSKIQKLHDKMQKNSEELILSAQRRELLTSKFCQNSLNTNNNEAPRDEMQDHGDEQKEYGEHKENVNNVDTEDYNNTNISKDLPNPKDISKELTMEEVDTNDKDYIHICPSIQQSRTDVEGTDTNSEEKDVQYNECKAEVVLISNQVDCALDSYSENFCADGKHINKSEDNCTTEQTNENVLANNDEHLCSEINTATERKILSQSPVEHLESSTQTDFLTSTLEEFFHSNHSNSDSQQYLAPSPVEQPQYIREINNEAGSSSRIDIPVYVNDLIPQHNESENSNSEQCSFYSASECNIDDGTKEDEPITQSLATTLSPNSESIGEGVTEKELIIPSPDILTNDVQEFDTSREYNTNSRTVATLHHDSVSMDGEYSGSHDSSQCQFHSLPTAKSLSEIILRTWAERQDSIEAKVTEWQASQPDLPVQTVAEVVLQQESKLTANKKEEERIQKDRCVEVYPETIRQRQRSMAPSPNKVDIKNWVATDETDASKDKKLLPSVKALRNQFENGGREDSRSPTGNSLTGRSSISSSTSSLSSPSVDVSSSHGSLNSAHCTVEHVQHIEADGPIDPIYRQFRNADPEFNDLMSKPPSTIGWNPQPLLKKLYHIPQTPKVTSKESQFIDIEGYLDKLPCGRKKSTFWNAWKRRYFCAKKGVLFCYHNNQMDKLSMKLPLLGGKVEIMDPNVVSVEDGKNEANSAAMLGIDDGKGHYVVVRCASRQDAERWKTAIESHVIDDFASQYVQPWPRSSNPSLLRDTIIIDIGSCSVRAGVLASQATLPQIFFPSVVATNRETQRQIWGTEALLPDVRSVSNVTFPIKPSHKISKFSVDLNAVSSLLQKTFADLKVDPKRYNIQLSVPRVLNPTTQTELMKLLFDKFGVQGVNLTHQSILALYAYNATSGIVVDIGERIDVVPIIDGYIVDGGVSRVPYGGFRILEHLRHYLFQKNVSLLNEAESYIIRAVLEMVCYCAQHYNTEKARCAKAPDNFEKHASLSDFFPNTSQFEAFHDISLNFGRFQATEGLFNPEAWGLDHPGLHKLVHKAIQECSMDIRKEMSKSIFLSGGVSQLPGLSDRLRTELDNLTPPAIRPKVHCSPYRYHASYLGACVLAESDAFSQSKISRDDWQKQGNSSLRKWAM